jgi:hypothetical protein
MVPISLLDDPRFWRDRAKEMRVLAEGVQHPEAKQIMAKMAQDYERLATLAEDLSQRQRRHEPD